MAFFCRKRILVWIIYQSCFSQSLFCQIQNTFDVSLKGNNITKSLVSHISVIDNRINNVYYTRPFPNGTIKEFYSGEMFSREIEAVMNQALSKIDCENDTLVICINAFRVPNLFELSLMEKADGEISKLTLRKYVYVNIDMYLKTAEQYKKVASLIHYRFIPNTFIEKTTNELINDIFQIACLFDKSKLLENSFMDRLREKKKESLQGLLFFSNNQVVSIDTLKNSIQNTWVKYKINNLNCFNKSGFAYNFIQFRNCEYTAQNIKFNYNQKDSTYELLGIEPKKLNRKLSYFVAHENNYYINLFNNKFLRLESFNNTFFFRIPETYPSLYEYLPIANEKKLKKWRSYNMGSKNFNDYNTKYRICYLDMDSGDVTHLLE